MFDEIVLNEKELPFNPKFNETVVEFLSRQKIPENHPEGTRFECRNCGDCCKWNYYKLDIPQGLRDELYMSGPRRPHGYWVLMEKLHCYMPINPGSKKGSLYHFEADIPEQHVEFCVRTGRTWGYWVLDDAGKVVVYCPMECQHLTKEKLCGIHRERPQVCREYMCSRYPVGGEQE